MSPEKASVQVWQSIGFSFYQHQSIRNNFGRKKKLRRSNNSNEVRLSLPLLLICNLTIGLIVGGIVYYWTNSSLFLTTTIPSDLVSFVNLLGNKVDAKHKASFQNFQIYPHHPSHSKFFTPVLESSYKTFWYNS